MKRSFFYSLLTTITVFSWTPEAFCGRTNEILNAFDFEEYGRKRASKKLYSKVYNSLFNELCGKVACEPIKLADLLSDKDLSEDAKAYKPAYLQMVMEILESDKNPAAKLNEIQQRRMDLRKRNQRELELMKWVELAEEYHKTCFDLLNEICNHTTPAFLAHYSEVANSTSDVNFGAHGYSVSAVVKAEKKASKTLRNAKAALQKFEDQWK